MPQTRENEMSEVTKEYGHIQPNGYRLIWHEGKNQLEHRVVAEQASGKPLPKGAVIHHRNRNKLDNRPENLLICKSHSEHKFIHSREDAFDVTGDPNKKRCKHCKEYDDSENLYINGTSAYHSDCDSMYQRSRK